MLENEKLLAQLKFDEEINISHALRWSLTDIKEMMDTYLEAKSVAQETNNTKLLLIVNEKISQLEKVIEIRKFKKPIYANKQPEV